MPETPQAMPRLTLSRLAPLAAIAAAAAAAFWFFGDLLQFETLREHRAELIAWREAHPALAAVSYVAGYIAVVTLSLPGAAIMTLAGGFFFGAATGTALTVVGATIGATLIFLAARHGLGNALHEKLTARGGRGAMARFEAGLRENEVSYLFLIRLVPAVPFFVANLAPAFLGVRLRLYVLTTALGIIPGTFVYSWIGSGLGEVFARGASPDLSIVTDPVVLGPLLGLAALAALPIVLKPVLKRMRVK